MAVQPQAYDAKYLAATEATGQAKNEAASYGVRIVEADVPAGQACWRVIGIHHLTPEENQGAHHVYVQALDEDGKRMPKDPKPVWVQWTWEGRGQNEPAPPAALDKGANEPGGNLPIWKTQVLSVWIAGLSSNDNQPSDRVEGLSTKHPDELGPAGETWNSWGHHSYYVVFQRRATTGKGVINGTIANGRGYRVRLLRGDAQVAEQVAGENGAFRFERLGRGSYRLDAIPPSIKSDPIALEAADQEVTVTLP